MPINFRHFFFLLSGLIPFWTISGQESPLSIDPDFTAMELVNDVFASGSCELITNISSLGDQRGIGYFEGGQEIFGFDRGIILSTGHVNDARGPNEDDDTSTELEGAVNDIDLDQISDAQLHDRVGIEFDFVPLDSNVTFRYIFASEEYCEFSNTDFNDVFGFFVSGPGLNGPFSGNGVNAALVTGTDQAVSVNTINHTFNQQFYRPNETEEDRNVCALDDDIETPQLANLAYDGYTTILTASLKLHPCETYRMRLVISDVNDADYDSAVMLEAGSFNLGGSVNLENSGPDTTNFLYEGCDNGGFRVTRGEDSDPSQPQTIRYRFSNDSEATEGVDFINPGGFVTIPAGDTFADVIIPTIDDGITEGPENIWLILDIPCACYTDSVLITLIEPGPLTINLEEAYYCPDQMATLNPMVSGGSPPYSYDWSFGDTSAAPTLAPPLPLSIELTVTDDCGQTTTRQIGTFSSQPPEAELTVPEIVACWGEARELTVNLVGRPPFTMSYLRSGGLEETLEFGSEGEHSWPIDLGGTYNITSITDQACSGSFSGTTTANFYRPVINPSVVNPNCANEPNGSITVQHLSSVPPYDYEWTGTNATGLVAENLPVGIYSLRITDAIGCSDERTFDLRGPAPITPVEITCPQVRRPPLILSADGGQAPYSYSVDDGETFFVADSFDLVLTPGLYYQLLIRDANGCELLQPDFFFPQATPRNTTLPVFVGQELGGSTIVEPNYQVPYDQIMDVQWYPAEYYDCPTCRTPVVSAPFSQPISLVVTDIYGCTDSLATWLGVDGRVPVYVPNAFSPNGDGTNDFVAVFGNLAQVQRVVSFQIFNRWGTQVWEDYDFTPNSARRGWDGKINGNDAQAGAYTWSAAFLLTNGDVVKKTGSVVLLR
ncbi:hypothetical protein CEQ90_17435 [Lewinellaceae bacterium SD302]|nr:hypothetical protein CEQ90_17435 [Lewinellaceae bacterium SD302]